METPTLSQPTSGVLPVWEELWQLEMLQKQSDPHLATSHTAAIHLMPLI